VLLECNNNNAVRECYNIRVVISSATTPTPTHPPKAASLPKQHSKVGASNRVSIERDAQKKWKEREREERERRGAKIGANDQPRTRGQRMEPKKTSATRGLYWQSNSGHRARHHYCAPATLGRAIADMFLQW